MKKSFKEVLPRALGLLVILALLTGVIYTLVCTGIGQAFFGRQVNGSIIEVDGKKYGSELLAQQYTDEKHMWGRIMNIGTGNFPDEEDGDPVIYGWANNANPGDEAFNEAVAERVAMIKEANPDMGDQPVPEDLVTMSGSGLDPHISIAAAQYQIPRIAKATGKSEEEVKAIVDKYTTGKFLGFMGESVVNVLQVNLALDGILK